MHHPVVRRRPLLARCAATVAVLLACTSAQAVNGNCEFRVVGTMSMSFGTIDPSSTTAAIATITPGQVAQIGSCRNVTMSVTADQGRNFSGSRRLALGAGAAFIPYSLTLPANRPGPGNNNWVDLEITGTIAPADFQNAPAGVYSDSVVITVSP